MQSRKSWLSGMVMGLLLLGLTHSGFGQQTIKVGSIPIIHELPLHAAMAQGYLAQEGIKAETEVLPGGAALIPALAGGSLQMGHSAYVALFAAREGGFDISVLFPYTQQPPGKDNSAILVLADSPVTTARGLEGKTVAVNVLRGPNWLYALEWMSKMGADALKVNWVEVPFPTMIGAVRTKKVDAAYATDPFIALEIERGGIRVVSRPFSEVDPEPEISGIVATEKWIKANPDLAARFARAIHKGMDWVNTNPEKRVELLAGYARIKPEWVPKLISPLWRFPINLERLQAASDLSLKWGLIKKKQDVRAFVWPTALR